MDKLKINGKEIDILEGNNINEIKTIIKTPQDFIDLKSMLEESTDEFKINETKYSYMNTTKPKLTVENGNFIAVFGFVAMNEREKEFVKLNKDNESVNKAIMELAGMIATLMSGGTK